MNNKTMVTSLTRLTIGDVLSGAVFRGPKKVDHDAILPFFLLPLLIYIGTISFPLTIIVMVTIGMGTLYVLSRPRAKNRSPFFFSWTLSSMVTMDIVYQYHALQFFRITILENLVFMVLVLCTCYCFHKMKAIADLELSGSAKGKEYSPVLTSDSYYCQVCQIEVNERFFHSIWWDCCVFKPNYCYFFAGQVFAFFSLLHGIDLSLTTACQPFVFFGNILIPQQCNHVYDTSASATIFVTSVYALAYLFVVTLVLIKQFVYYIPKYLGFQWKHYMNVLNV